METPYIHLFEANHKKYVFDVNTQAVLTVPDNVYRYLKLNDESILDEEVKGYINVLKQKGFLLTNHVKETEHNATKLLPYYFKYNLNYLILQVTQNCNLRCDYCVYSGGYKTRGHSKRNMTFETAKKGIDYILAHSQSAKMLVLGFYGGEPLMEFDLIQKCVSYIESKVEGKELWYAITTNGTLLTPKIVDYMVKHNFSITLSIDGPKEKHDEYRKFAGSNKGSFDVITKNIQYIKQNYPKFFHTKVMVNTVLDIGRSFNEISDFFKNSQVFNQINIRSAVISDDYAKDDHGVSDVYREESRHEQFKALLATLGRLDKKFVSPLLVNYASELKKLQLGTIEQHRTSVGEVNHHGGPCVPGGDRIFMNVDGEFYPCEKVCELSEFSKLGDVNTGINLAQAEKMLNIERITSSKCHKCWAYDFCDVCVRVADDNDSNLRENIYRQCVNTKSDIEEMLKDYCFLVEYGFNFETMKCEKRK